MYDSSTVYLSFIYFHLSFPYFLCRLMWGLTRSIEQTALQLYGTSQTSNESPEEIQVRL